MLVLVLIPYSTHLVVMEFLQLEHLVAAPAVVVVVLVDLVVLVEESLILVHLLLLEMLVEMIQELIQYRKEIHQKL
jgi:hypothetical protein